jgi:GNAT superfamily N-acetyltransferase
VVGYLVVEKSARPPVLAHSNYGVFEEICVAPSARRAGVGKALVSVGLEWCEGKGLCAAQVGYAADNPMSVPFWEGLGFRRYQISGVRALGARQPNHSASTVDLSSSYPETHPASRILVQPLSWYSRQSLIPLFREAAQDGTGC